MLFNLLSNLICFFKKITTPRDYSVVKEELEYSVDYDMRYRIEDDFWKVESKDWDGILENFHVDVTGLDFRYTAIPENCLLYTSPSPRDQRGSRMPSSA